MAPAHVTSLFRYMAAPPIVVKGAREHNLRDVTVALPRGRLVCLSGVSGSGKSSLAFDTLYAEGQRRYVESLSTFARQFLGQLPRPDVDSVTGLSPAISIAQKSAGTNPRSTVATMTEIHDFLRVLYARVGTAHCPQCDSVLEAQPRDQIVERILAARGGIQVMVLAPLVRDAKGEHRDLFADLVRQGFTRARVDGRICRVEDPPALEKTLKHRIDVVVDRLVPDTATRSRLAEAVDLALKTGGGQVIVATEEKHADLPEPAAAGRGPKQPPTTAKKRPAAAAAAAGPDLVLSSRYACVRCGTSYDTPEPQLFSFNSPQGACSACDGLGEIYGIDPAKLVTDPDKTLRKGAIGVLGGYRDMPRWLRRLLNGVAAQAEADRKLPPGTLLDTPWKDLTPLQRRIWLDGAGLGALRITWKRGKAERGAKTTFEGIRALLANRWRNAKSGILRRMLEKLMSVTPCHACHGARLGPQPRAVRIATASSAARAAGPAELSIDALCGLPIAAAREFLAALVLDEPSIGLHPRDNTRLLGALEALRDKGNTVVVVEHDEETIRAADWVVDFGPGPGKRGGELVVAGPPDDVAACGRSVTGGFLAGRERIDLPQHRRRPDERRLVLRGVSHNNLRGIDVSIPLGLLVCVTGVSGSGKSSLVGDVLEPRLRGLLSGAAVAGGACAGIEGAEHLDKVIVIDQSPIGRTPRSNPATYVKVWDDIRDLLTMLPEAKKRGWKPGRFSFNVAGGRCEACEGNGSVRLDMDFLADVWVTCEVCGGARFAKDTLEVRWKGKNVAELLNLAIG
ncbi:MAG: excinuclease ABC subunit UvrA [Planctomycetia bacterium]